MPERRRGRRIGELAASAGVTVDTLRYYEREGLVSKPARTSGGFRIYPPETVQRLRLIKQAQALGLTLRDIRLLFGYDARRGPERCARVRGVIAKRLADVDERIRELRTFRRALRTALRECDDAVGRPQDADCPVAEQLEAV